MTDRTELRRLLDEATPGPWHAWNRGIGFEIHTEAEHNPIRCDPLNSGFRETLGGPDAYLIAAAVNALPSLLDQLDAAEAALNDAILYWKDTRDALARQTPHYLAAEAALARVRELHYPADNAPARTPVCKDCHGKAGTHPCGCWAEVDREPVCGHCNQGYKGLAVAWPCPTIRALDGEADR